MTTSAIRKKLSEYINTADEKKVRAIYALIVPDEDVSEWWQDEKFLAELEKQSEAIESGRETGVTWDEVRKGALQRINR